MSLQRNASPEIILFQYFDVVFNNSKLIFMP